MTQFNNNRFTHSYAIPLITVLFILSAFAIFAVADGESSENVGSGNHHHWPDIRIAFNTLLSIFLFTLSMAKTVVSRTASIAFSPVRFSWRATKWMTLTVWRSVVNFVSTPIVAYILVAISCGAVIGGCAGFAVELFTTLLYSITCGKGTTPAAVDEKEQDAEDAQNIDGDDKIKQHDDKYDDGEEDDQLSSDAMLELLHHHLAVYTKNDQSVNLQASPSSSSSAAPPLEASR
ncbi:hypothetical protein BX666DRAFT_418754 [Dichotomocladium elegans]|nr:hypothetical protein BX666DRAFT_418754 [Dichotomocladium elegans]